MEDREAERARERAYHRAWRARNRERERASDRARREKNREALNAAARARYAANAEVERTRRRAAKAANYVAWLANHRAWYARTAEARRAASRADYRRHRTERIAEAASQARTPKGRARIALELAIRRGEVVRPETCSRCGASGRIHGHHPDYSRPLEVLWLCQACHATEHRRTRARGPLPAL